MRDFEEFEEFEDRDGGHEQHIDIMPYVRLLLKKWKTILLWALAGGVVGVVIGLSTPRTYTTKAVVAPELATRSTLGSGLNSLASLAGVNMNSLALTDAMHPDLYPEVIKSTNMYISLFDMPVTVETRDSLVHTDLYDYMITYNKHPWWVYVMGLPRMAVEGVKGLFSEKDELDDAEGHENVDSLRLTKQQERVIKALSKNISATVEKKTYVLSIKVKMQDPVISAQLANLLIDHLKDFVVSYRTEKARENVDYYKTVMERVRKEYLAAQRAYSLYADSHQGVMTRSARIYEQQLQNEAQLRYQMYNQTAQNLLSAEAKVQQESPVLVIIQPGVAPHIGSPSRVKLAMLWFLLGAAAGFAWILFRERRKSE
ncbi:MAG: hypothetical protein J6X71_08855 [Bacteroidales bacterium]|nr:hypothetical protein [Bacteroidales bacterium]